VEDALVSHGPGLGLLITFPAGQVVLFFLSVCHPGSSPFGSLFSSKYPWCFLGGSYFGIAGVGVSLGHADLAALYGSWSLNCVLWWFLGIPPRYWPVLSLASLVVSFPACLGTAWPRGSLGWALPSF